jgi:hypothetical protein
MVRSEGNRSLENPVTPLAIDPVTVQLVAQRLNHYATPGPVYTHTHIFKHIEVYLTVTGHFLHCQSGVCLLKSCAGVNHQTRTGRWYRFRNLICVDPIKLSTSLSTQYSTQNEWTYAAASPHLKTQILTSDFNQDQKAPWWWSADDRNMLEWF